MKNQNAEMSLFFGGIVQVDAQVALGRRFGPLQDEPNAYGEISPGHDKKV